MVFKLKTAFSLDYKALYVIIVPQVLVLPFFCVTTQKETFIEHILSGKQGNTKNRLYELVRNAILQLMTYNTYYLLGGRTDGKQMGVPFQRR